MEILAKDRIERQEKTRPVKEVAAIVLDECVTAVCETLASSRVRKVQVESKEKELVVKPVVNPVVRRKRRRVWDTWVKRCYAIYMYMHPQIFNCDASEASEVLGTSRTTLLGWVTLSVKKNYVNKWFDIVANLTWADVKRNFNEELTDKQNHIPEDSKVNLSK